MRLSASGSSVCAPVSAPRSPAATAAGTREARQGRSREVPSPSSAASARRGLQSSLGTAPGTRPRSQRQRRVLSAAFKSHPRALSALAGCLRGSLQGRREEAVPREGWKPAGGRRGVLFGDGEGGEKQQPELPPCCRQPPSSGPWSLSLSAANLTLRGHP